LIAFLFGVQECLANDRPFTIEILALGPEGPLIVDRVTGGTVFCKNDRPLSSTAKVRLRQANLAFS
jgi:hypothetical protein